MNKFKYLIKVYNKMIFKYLSVVWTIISFGPNTFKKTFGKCDYTGQLLLAILLLFILILIMAICYKNIHDRDAKAFTQENMSFIDMFYFATITTFTVGYGDINPISSAARTFVFINSYVFWVYMLAIGLL